MHMSKGAHKTGVVSRIMPLALAVLASFAQSHHAHAQISDEEWNHQIRREKFDQVLPLVMRKYGVDMWIHVMREAIPDTFGAHELGTTSGIIVFTDTGEGRIERAAMGRRWGRTQREYDAPDTSTVEESGAYDFIAPAVMVRELPSTPMTEHDYRFKGLREYVVERDPEVIAVNFVEDLGLWPTSRGLLDGISHTDYLLLEKELGTPYAERVISSEYLVMSYIAHKVPSEIDMLRKISADKVAEAKARFAAVVPGVTRSDDTGLTTFRRMRTGQSQRGRSAGWEDSIVQGGDILASPSYGMYAYVLRDGESEPPPEIQRLWEQYLKVDAILADTIRSGRTPREIVAEYKKRFEEAGIVVRENQLHMEIPKNDYPAYMKGFELNQTHISIDCHGQMKGARPESVENYLAPRIGSLGPDWALGIELPEHHHFVIEYFFYMPSTGPEGKDQYLFWWAHEQAICDENGIIYLTPPQEELILVGK